MEILQEGHLLCFLWGLVLVLLVRLIGLKLLTLQVTLWIGGCWKKLQFLGQEEKFLILYVDNGLEVLRSMMMMMKLSMKRFFSFLDVFLSLSWMFFFVCLEIKYCLFYEKVVLYPSEPGETEPEEELFEWDDTDDILKLSLGRSAVPADEKIKFGYKSVVRKNNGYAGEDAFFVSQGSATEKRKEKGIHSEMSYTFSPSDYLPPCYYLGVADGVGMWRTHGVDSGIYSRHLLHSAREVISVHENPEPFLVLRSAWEKTTIVDGIKGSCTVCLIRVRPDGWADGVQVGDAGLALVRGGLLKLICLLKVFFLKKKERSEVFLYVPQIIECFQ